MTSPLESHLTAPVASDPVPDLVEQAIGFPQFLSPTYYLGGVVQALTGANPWVETAAWISGDWEGVQRVASALRNLADFQADFAEQTTAELTTVRSTWEGNAASGAETWFSGLASSVASQAPDLRSMAGELDSIAFGMYETANAVRGLIEQMGDLAVLWLANSAAMAAIGWTGIGGAALAASMAVIIYKLGSTWQTLLTVQTSVWNGVQATVGVIAGYLGGLEDLDLHALPSSSYDHPGV